MIFSTPGPGDPREEGIWSTADVGVGYGGHGAEFFFLKDSKED